MRLLEALAIGGSVEPTALAGRMRERDHYRLVAERAPDPFLQRTWAEKASDRHLPDQNHHAGSQHLQLGVHPVRTVGNGCRRWTQVAGSRAVAAREAAHQRSDVGDAAEFLGAREAVAQHPSVELFARPPREPTSAPPLRPP